MIYAFGGFQVWSPPIVFKGASKGEPATKSRNFSYKIKLSAIFLLI